MIFIYGVLFAVNIRDPCIMNSLLAPADNPYFFVSCAFHRALAEPCKHALRPHLLFCMSTFHYSCNHYVINVCTHLCSLDNMLKQSACNPPCMYHAFLTRTAASRALFSAFANGGRNETGSSSGTGPTCVFHFYLLHPSCIVHCLMQMRSSCHAACNLSSSTLLQHGVYGLTKLWVCHF